MRLFVESVVARGFDADSCGECARRAPSDFDLSDVPPRLRRGLSWHQRAGLDAFLRLVPHDARGDIPIVHGSTLAEVATAVALASSQEPSPARFSTSVHSAFCGLASVAFGNKHGHITLSAAADTLFACLAEAADRIARGAPRVCVVVADEVEPALPGGDPVAHCTGFVVAGTDTHGARPVRIADPGALEGMPRTSRALLADFAHAVGCVQGKTELRPSRATWPHVIVLPRGESRA